MFTADRSIVDNLNMELVEKFLTRHEKELSRFKKLEDYYKGPGKENVNCNHAAEIVDNATGYFMGSELTYLAADEENEALDLIRECFDECDIDGVDDDLAFNLSLFGRAYELVVASEDDKPLPESYSVEPFNAFVVYDNTLRHEPLFAVYYLPVYDLDGKLTGYRLYVYTDSLMYEGSCDDRYVGTLGEPTEHYFGSVPIIEYQNNKYSLSDFEGVISLIDAYNKVMSLRLEDKEQFIDALLVLTNYILGEDADEASETLEYMRKNKILELGPDGKAEYLTRTLDEAGVEILRKAIEADIHKLSRVPCLTDENFAGNSSGVALEYKLLGLENLCKTKEKYYKKGISRRMELYENFLSIKGAPELGKYTVQFSRGLPKNVMELAQIINLLAGKVSKETLLSLLPFIKDASAEIDKLLDDENTYGEPRGSAGADDGDVIEDE